MSTPPPGRGTTLNPANRYERFHLEREPDDELPSEDRSAEPTELYRDTSRTVLAENASPDVGFRFSLNPYRGCEHGCSYCLTPNTPVLYADYSWRPIGSVQIGDELAGFDERPLPGRTRKLRRSVVRDVWWSKRPTQRLVTRHAEVVTTATACAVA